MTESAVRLRRGMAGPDDARIAYDIFLPAVRDLTQRQGTPWDPDADALWDELRPMYEYFGAHGAEFWIAEDEATGEPIGYARSVERGGLFELSEIFVRPGRQAAGIGAQLMERAFPPGRGEVRVIIATTDVRAQARYYRAGCVAQFPIVTMETESPVATPIDTDLEATPATAADIADLCRVERAVLEFDRGDEFGWILEGREGFVYRRGGETVGFGFVGPDNSGPVAALDPDDQPAILAHLEARAAERGMERLAFEVPMPNGVAMNHLLGRGFRMDPFYTFLMASRPFGRFDRFIGYAPPFVL